MKTTPPQTTDSPAFNPLLANERLLEMWMHGKSPHTVASYRHYSQGFVTYLNKPLHLLSLADVQGWTKTLHPLSASSQRTAIAVIKSLLSFLHRNGIIRTNPGVEIKPPNAKDTLNERILSEAEVQSMIELETNPRNRIMLRLLYSGGLRVSELVELHWRDISPRPNGGQLTIFGKGSKTRFVLLAPGAYAELLTLRRNRAEDEPVFVSRENDQQGKHLDRSQVYRIVRAAAKRAGIKGKVSPHWLRHAHASHSLDRGAPIHLVQQTLGHASVATTSRYLHARPNESSSLYLAD